MSGLSDEAVLEGHDLVDAAEHEAQADPKDFKKVHHVGETGGSILPDDAAPTGKAANPGEFLGSKLNDIKDSLTSKK